MSGPAAGPAAAPGDLRLILGPVEVRIGTAPELVRRAVALRQRVFGARSGAGFDRFDGLSLHGVVADRATGSSCVAFRIRLFSDASRLRGSYSGQFYDLDPLARCGGTVLELGRLCQDRDARAHPVALRAAWAALTAVVDAQGVTCLIGCTSFPGSDPRRHAGALATLRARHLGPSDLRPGRRSSDAVDLPGPDTTPGPLPPLLRGYLAMGGWVSDHAVRDPELDTLHVFTGLRVADIPPSRKARLRALVHAGTPKHPLDAETAAP